ncbi:MAG TPA: cell division protein FtsQ/DivIB [Baekduia sp.]|nr:cell division protein FtsQ/DivIB [Baekduia sp.]
MHRAAALPRIRTAPRVPRAVVWIVPLLALVVVGGLWLRDSSLVAVKRVTVTGLSGPNAVAVSRALESAARDMTTLHVREDELRAVAAPYPIVKNLHVETDFPHGMTIAVDANVPVAAVSVDGVTTPVGSDDRLLRGAAHGPLPVVSLRAAPGDRVTERDAIAAIAAIAAAPQPLRERIERASTDPQQGLVLELRDGPQLRFGEGDRLAAKWAAAAAVLAHPDSAGATYVDVRYPERPAAGGLEDPASQRDPTVVPDATETTATASPDAVAGTTP